MIKDTVTIQKTCPWCGKKSYVTVYASDWDNYYINGEYVQRAFPYLNAVEREMIISGMCSKCQDIMFSHDED